MKKSYLNSFTVGLFCAGTLLMGTITQTGFAAAQSGGEGRLIITRSPKLGSGTAIGVSIDGKKVGSIIAGRKYEASMAPGKHTLTIKFEPLSASDKPASIEINVVPGETYSYTATIQHGDITLAKSR